MAIYRTAQGRKLDMGQLAAKNEKTRAVGNMNVNARGDTIDSKGNVIVPVTKKVGKNYQNAVQSTNRATSNLRPQTEKTVDASSTSVQEPSSITESPVVQAASAPVISATETPAVQAAVAPIYEEMSEEDLEFLEPTEEDLEIEEIKKAELEAKSKKK